MSGSSVFGGAEHAAKSATGFFTSSGSSEQVTSLQKQVLQLRAELSMAQTQQG